MTLSSRACRLGLSLSALVIFGFAGCKSNGVQAAGSGQGSDLSGPPTMNADYGARNARVCAKVTSAPTPAQAAALVQCQGEGMIRNDLWLITDLQVEMGSPRAVTYGDSNINDLDSAAKIYPLRGQGTQWSCGLVSQWGAGTNCQKFTSTPGGTGRCWHTLFNEWKCSMTVGGPKWVAHMPGPTTY